MLFKKKFVIKSPVKGTIMPTESVPDDTFAKSLLGETRVISPTDDIVCSPINGKLTMVADTLHAFGLEDYKGAEFLVHIGVDTVKMKGEGFELLAKNGTEVKCGDPIIKMNRELIKSYGYDASVIFILISTDTFVVEDKFKSTDVTPVDEVAIYYKK